MERDELLNQFLSKHGWDTAERKLLARDASFRWYDRLKKENQSMVLMNAPIPQEDPAQFVFVDEILEKIGTKVPHIHCRDLDNGFLLLEDFGDDTFTRLIAKGADEMALYKKAIEALIHIQRNIKQNVGLKDYDFELMFFEASLLPLWYIKHVIGKDVDEEGMQEFEAIWRELFAIITQVPNSLVLLDYHVDNLMITKDNQCGLLDFQDARFGPVTYDLASLLEDARRTVPEDIQSAMKQYYFEQLPEYNTPEFHQSYPIMAVQRHTKVIGIFVRLFARDNKDRYLKFIPFVWSLLEKHLDNPLLARYKKWLDKYVPVDVRRQVPFQNRINHD